MLTAFTASAMNPGQAKLNVPDNSRTTMRARIDGHGTVRAMYNINFQSRESSPERAAREYLLGMTGAFRINSPGTSLRTDDVQQIISGSHVRFTQTYQDIPVFRGDIVVSLDAANSVTMVVNNFKESVHIPSIIPFLSDVAAVQLAHNRVSIKGRTTGQPDRSSLMIYRTESGVDHLAYQILMSNEDPLGDWQVFIDANTGDVLSIEDLFADERVQGSGYVFLSDPLSDARKIYNSPGFTDNNDADSDSLTAHRSYVILDSLTHEGGVYKLKGPYCNVTDVESPADPLFYASSTPDGFTDTRSAQRFEAVNVYYHATTAYKHLLELGFSVPTLTQIRLDPHGYLGGDNSHYSPTGNWISWGEGGVDDAEDADVIWHEYGHAIMYNIIPSWGGGESGALGEGFGDYWAGSYSHSLNQWAPTDAQYNWVFNWDGHNTFWLGRILNDSRTYPFGGLEIHAAGQIWSSALTGIAGDLGRTIADRLIIKSFYYLGSGTTGPDAAQAILQADRDLYGGAHLQTLVYWLGTVKHFIDPAAVLPSITHTPFSGVQDERGPFAIHATITSQNGLASGGAYVVWGRGEVFSDTAVMTPAQSPSEYEAFIPGNGEPGVVRYYIVAIDTTRAASTSPMNAPAAYYSFQTGQPQVSGVPDPHVVPLAYSLGQNFPNPFNPSTVIGFDLPEAGHVSLVVYDMQGRRVADLASDHRQAGHHSVTWNASGIASGVYFARLNVTNTDGRAVYSSISKMVLIR